MSPVPHLWEQPGATILPKEHARPPLEVLTGCPSVRPLGPEGCSSVSVSHFTCREEVPPLSPSQKGQQGGHRLGRLHRGNAHVTVLRKGERVLCLEQCILSASISGQGHWNLSRGTICPMSPLNLTPDLCWSGGSQVPCGQGTAQSGNSMTDTLLICEGLVQAVTVCGP